MHLMQIDVHSMYVEQVIHPLAVIVLWEILEEFKDEFPEKSFEVFL